MPGEGIVETQDKGTGEIPRLTERTYDYHNPSFNAKDGIVVQVSAVTGDGIDALLEVIRQQVEKAKTKMTVLLPYKDAGVLDFIRKNGNVEDVEYLDTGIRAVVRMPPSKLAYIDKYVIK
jgi:50S ribosomal subunit-associated GTPase HflX